MKFKNIIFVFKDILDPGEMHIWWLFAWFTKTKEVSGMDRGHIFKFLVCYNRLQHMSF